MFHAAATYVERAFVAAGHTPHRESYDVTRSDATHRVSNIVAEIIAPDRSTSDPGPVVIVGAHYDSVFSTPGADDNGSAVAMLLETARLLLGIRPRFTIRFVSFACEEPPHFHTSEMGSQWHARQCRLRNEIVRGMICLEMVGYYSDAPNSQRLPPGIPKPLRRLFPSRGNFLAAVGNLRSIPLVWGFRRGFRRASRFPLFSIALPERINEIRLSDNSSFWDQSYPALMLTDTSFLRNPNYHLASDTPDTLDYDRMAEATIGVAGAVAHLAKARWP